MISTAVHEGIVVVAIDRPDRYNGLTPELASALVEELGVASAPRRPVVLTGTGATFCPGADLKWLAECDDPAQGVAELVALHHLAITTLLDLPVPVVAAINGSVAGGGLGLALASDYRVASESASFTAAYFRLGLTPDGGSSAFLQMTIGRPRTLDMLLTNRRVGAREALAWSLVNEVVVDGEVVERAVAFARELATVPSYALRQTRQLLDTVNIRNQLQLESVSIRTAARGEFFREALRAFVAAHPGDRLPG